MPFLDLNITRSPQGLTFGVYRKTTHTDLYTHFYSAHPTATKKGTINSLFLRALRLCSPEHLQSEIEHIRSAFLRVKYPDYVINEALSKAKRRFHNPAICERPRAKYHLSLPYTDELLALRPALAKLNVSTSFFSNNTIGHQLSKTGPRSTSDKDLPGVYKVSCLNCPGVYFGETGRTLSLRMRDHKNSINRKIKDNALFVHISNNPSHSFDLEGAELLYKSNHSTRRQLVESSLISTQANINIKPGDFPTCRLTAPIVLKFCLNKEKNRSNAHTTTTTTMNTLATTSSDTSSQLPQTSALQAQQLPADTSNTQSCPLQSQPSQSPAYSPSIKSSQSMPLPLAQTLTNLKPSHLKHSSLPPVPQIPATPPVSQRTRSHKPHCHNPSASNPSVSPMVLQSQARAMPFTFNIPSSPLPSPVAGRTRRQLSQKYTASFSPYPSPLSITGATRKRPTKLYPDTMKFAPINIHSQLYSPYPQKSQKDYPTHRRKKTKPY